MKYFQILPILLICIIIFLSFLQCNKQKNSIVNIKVVSIAKPNIFFMSKIWPSRNSNNTMCFPEKILVPNIKNSTNLIGLCYSGGGSRSLTCMIGYMRAMLRIKRKDGKNLYESANYVSTVSGGSWFHSIYTLARKRGYTVQDLLGTGRLPKDITLTNLQNDNFQNINDDSKCSFIGARASTISIITNIIKYVGVSNNILNRWWNYVVGIAFLSPYGINLDAPIALDYNSASNIYKNNPSITFPEYPMPGDPFWLCNTCILYKPLTDYGFYTNIVMTPIYSGLCQQFTIGSNTIGDKWIETFATDSYAPSATITKPTCTTPSTVNVKSAKNGQSISLSIKDMIGASSAFLADILYEKIPINSLQKFNNKISLWNFNKNNIEVQLSDGAFADNSGMLSLLSRNVTKIIYFNNTEKSILDKEFFKPYFGLCTDCSKCTTNEQLACNKTQVFKSSEYSNFYNSIYNSYKSGGPTFVNIKLDVLPNSLFGIAGNYKVELLMLVIQPSNEFKNSLISSVRSEFDFTDEFENFPNYSTVMENLGKFAELSHKQINLLACYTEWCLLHPTVKNAIKTILPEFSYI